MGVLRDRMIRELQLGRYAARTQKAYLEAVKGLAKHFMIAPDELSAHSGYYAVLTFGALIFMVAGLYLPQILKLKVAGIQLEKSSAEQITTPSALGISK